MDKIIIERAALKDNFELCELCKIPMAGPISLTMEREPDYFLAAKVQNEHVNIFVCRDLRSGSVVGVFSLGERTVFYNGSQTMIPYFSDLRIHPDFQRSWLLFKINKFLAAHKLIDENEYALGIAFAGNKVAAKIAGRLSDRIANRFSFLKMLQHGYYCSYMVSLSLKIKIGPTELCIRRAANNDRTKMQEFFNREAQSKDWYPYYDFSTIENTGYYTGLTIENYYLAFLSGELVGITGMWDQKAFKQTRVVAYSKSMRVARPLVNLYAKISRGFQLPVAGESLNYFTLHTIVTKSNNVNIFSSLVHKIYADHYKKGYSYFLCGLDMRDALNGVFSQFRHKRIMKANLYLLSGRSVAPANFDNSRVFYIEAARI